MATLIDPECSPAWTDGGTLLLPVAATAWPSPDAPLQLDGIAFVPKRELHVTVVGRTLGAHLHEAGLQAETLAVAATLDWRFERCGQWLRLEARTDGRRRHSIIERIALPALATLHAWLGARLGRQLAVPPPHVTLYTSGDDRGIGVPDAASLARLSVRAVDAAELGLR